jgi:outer membrane protein assembly factor BamB
VLPTLTIAALALLAQEDWPGWRGAGHAGVSAETAWADTGVRAWSRDVGLGHSAAAVVGGRLYTLGFDALAEVDRVWCLDAGTGEVLWQDAYAGLLRDQNHTGGTLTSPAVHAGRLYVSTREGELRCYDAIGGTLRWRVDVAQHAETQPGLYGFSGSPLVLGPHVVVAVGRVVALDAESGEVRWTTEDLEAQYSTPTPFVLDGQERLAVFTEAALQVLDPGTGATLFTHPWRPQPRGVNVATPVVVGERLFVSSAYERGCALVELGQEGAEAVWANRRMRNKMAGCVLVNGLLVGLDESVLKCLDLEGQERWRKRGLGNGAISAAGDRLVLTSSKGELIVARATPEAYVELSRTRLFDQGTFWSPPVIAHGRIYVRSGLGELACVDHRAAGDAEVTGTERPATEELPDAARLFGRHLELVGGGRAVAAVEGMRITGTFEMRSVGFPEVEFTIQRRAPNLYHAEIGLPAPIQGTMQRVFDGEVAFEINPYRGDKLLPEDVRREYADTTDLAAAANYARSYRSMETVGSAEFADRPCWRVDTVTASGTKRSVYFSRETELLVGREGERESIVLFDEYRPFGDLLIPTLEKHYQQETGIEEVWRVEELELVEVDEAIFERPESIRELLDDR